MFRLVSAMVLALGVSSQALAVDEGYFQIQDMSVTQVPVESLQQGMQTMDLGAFGQDCNNTVQQNGPVLQSVVDDISPITTVGIYLDQIVNLGKKVWALIELGKPVYNLKFDTASALPKGLQCWTDLSGWQAPQTQAYKVEYKNVYGFTVVSYTYRVTATTGGGLNGAGKYITHATFQPADVYVAWGYKFNASAAVPSVFNMGTTSNPVAGLQMDMTWKVDTIMNHAESTDSFHVSGENVLQRLK